MSKRRKQSLKRKRLTRLQQIQKSSGQFEPFLPEKLQTSLIRCGAPREEAIKIASALQKISIPIVSTATIRQKVLNKLKSHYPAVATRYNLSHAVSRLGPSGFPFEKLIARLLVSEGYQIELNAIKQGRCISHEVDIIAKKEGRVEFIDCKFHQEPFGVSDVKTVLYLKARSDDLNQSQDPSSRHHSFMVVTNTRFTQDAIQYAQCVGLMLVGWIYPEHQSLSLRLEKSGLIPLTALTSLPKRMVDLLIDDGVITLSDLLSENTAWKLINQFPKIASALYHEIDVLYETRPTALNQK
jgi:hypothetical protein